MKASNGIYSHLTALIVDDHASQRQQLKWHISQLGIEAIDQASTAQEALSALSKRDYDLVMCDYNLDSTSRNAVSNGQQLLEHAKSTAILGPSTIFMMVSGNNSYKDIASAVEQKPDAYLVKPIATKTLEDRLQRLLQKQQALLPITNRQRAKDHVNAIEAAIQVREAHPEFTLSALQLKGESELELGQFDAALQSFEEVIGLTPQLDWAYFGKARALRGLRKTEETKLILNELVGRNRLYTSAYELLAAIAEQEGKDSEAVVILQRSIKELPSPRRARSLADAAYRSGDVKTARSNYETAFKATKGSFVARTSDVVMLAQSALDMGDADDALRLVAENMEQLKAAPAVHATAHALRAQAYQLNGDQQNAKEASSQAKQLLESSPGSHMDALVVAKGLLVVGDMDGVKLLEKAVRGDHENIKVLSLARKVLQDTGHSALEEQTVDSVASEVQATLEQAKKLRREGLFEEARTTVDQALLDLPNNTGVLIEAAQVYLLSLMRQTSKEKGMLVAVRNFLDKLDKLLPGSERVAAQHAYFRRVLADCKAGAR